MSKKHFAPWFSWITYCMIYRQTSCPIRGSWYIKNNGKSEDLWQGFFSVRKNVHNIFARLNRLFPLPFPFAIFDRSHQKVQFWLKSLNISVISYSIFPINTLSLKINYSQLNRYVCRAYSNSCSLLDSW